MDHVAALAWAMFASIAVIGLAVVGFNQIIIVKRIHALENKGKRKHKKVPAGETAA